MRTDQQVKNQAATLDLQQLYGQVSGVVNKLEVGEVRITDAALTQHSKTNPSQLLQQLDHSTFELATFDCRILEGQFSINCYI